MLFAAARAGRDYYAPPAQTSVRPASRPRASGLREDSDRQLTVGLNLVLRSVERLGDEAVRLSETESDLVGAPRSRGAAGPRGVARARRPRTCRRRGCRCSTRAARSLDRTIGGAQARFADVGATKDDPAVVAGLSWSRTVRLVAVNDQVVVRAVTPVVDPNLAIRGVLVLSMPLDGEFADSIKGALSADVMIGGTSGRLAVTFRSPLGRRGEPLQLDPADLLIALDGRRVHENVDTQTGYYAIAATGLLDHKDRAVGVIAVAVDRGPLAGTKRLAVRSLVAGGMLALAFALVLALFWSRRIGAPIQRLHRGAIAVSRGDLDHRIEMPGRDELTDLAGAFNQMTSTLKDNQARLAARMREIVALHDAGRAVSSVIDLDQVSRKIVDAVARTFDVQLVALWIVEPNSTPEAPELRASAARARRTDVSSSLATDEALAAAKTLVPIAARVAAARAPLRLDRAGGDLEHGNVAMAAGTPGPFTALPLERPLPISIAEALDARRRRARGRARRAWLHRRRSQLADDVRGSSRRRGRERAALSGGARRERGARAQGPAAHRRADRDQLRARQGARRPARDPGPARAQRAHGRPRHARGRRRPRDQLADRGDPRLDRGPRRGARPGRAPRRRAGDARAVTGGGARRSRITSR